VLKSACVPGGSSVSPFGRYPTPFAGPAGAPFPGLPGFPPASHRDMTPLAPLAGLHDHWRG